MRHFCRMRLLSAFSLWKTPSSCRCGGVEVPERSQKCCEVCRSNIFLFSNVYGAFDAIASVNNIVDGCRHFHTFNRRDREKQQWWRSAIGVAAKKLIFSLHSSVVCWLKWVQESDFHTSELYSLLVCLINSFRMHLHTLLQSFTYFSRLYESSASFVFALCTVFISWILDFFRVSNSLGCVHRLVDCI